MESSQRGAAQAALAGARAWSRRLAVVARHWPALGGVDRVGDGRGRALDGGGVASPP